MQILVITGTFHPDAGGPPTYLYHLLPKLVKRGHSVSVLTFGDVERAFEYPYLVTRVSLRQPIAKRLLAMIGEILRQGRGADVLFVSDYGLPAALANLWLRKPLVIKVVSDFAWEFSVRRGLIAPDTLMDDFQAERYGLRVGLLRFIQHFYVRAARRVIVPSQYIQSIVSGWGIDSGNVTVVYNAPSLAAFEQLPPKETVRAQLGVEGRLIVCVARLTVWKGVDGLLRAVDEVRRSGIGVHLYVVGDGPERARLETLVSGMKLAECVHFVGHVAHEDAVRYLRAADVFALFSTYEGLPHVVLEAMAAGTPVVASAAGGTPEVISDGESGLLVPVGDEAALAEQLRRVLTDTSLAAQLAAGGQAELDRFSMTHMVEETEAVLRGVAEGSRAK